MRLFGLVTAVALLGPLTAAPARGTPANGAPVTDASVTGASANGGLANGASANGAPANGAPANGTPTNGTPHVVLKDGMTQPTFSYQDAIRETVYVDVPIDSDHD